MARLTREQREKINAERREIFCLDNYEARRLVVENYPFMEERDCEAYCKIVWYSDELGGKLITFKAGNPHVPKKGTRKEGTVSTDEEREAERLQASLSRTRKNIFEIAACNPWEWFFTGTLDGEKVDREDLNGTFRKLSQFVRDERKRTGENIKYLIVPERHKAGGWHFHGLLHGLSESQMFKFCTTDNIPTRIRKTIEGGTDVWTWKPYAEKFGYSTVTRIKSTAAVSCYITKYITKDMVRDKLSDTIDAGRHLYYASQGLQRAATVAESYVNTSYAPTYDFENAWVQIRKIGTREEMQAIIKQYGLRKET